MPESSKALKHMLMLNIRIIPLTLQLSVVQALMDTFHFLILQKVFNLDYNELILPETPPIH